MGNRDLWSVPAFGGITRAGSSGSYTYSAIAGREDMPVNYVSFYDSLRFANWLSNGQPTGAQDSTTTEDGSYTFSGATTVGARNSGATVFLPSDDEWYKAAYYNPLSGTYYLYTTSSDSWPSCAFPGPTPNTANCYPSVGDVTDVGSYTGSASPNETFDQGGNVWERNEAMIGANGVIRGGAFGISQNPIGSTSQYIADRALENGFIGLRVAALPGSQAVPLLGPLGVALVGIAVGLSGLRRLRA